MYYGKVAVADPVDAPLTGRWERSVSNPILPVGAGGAWDDFWVPIHSIWWKPWEILIYKGYIKKGDE